MVENQNFGFDFEKWIKKNIFFDYQGNYGDKWDVEKIYKSISTYPSSYRSLPISIKTANENGPVYFGDILRQRAIDEKFIIIVGFWHQVDDLNKKLTGIGHTLITPQIWENLWGNLSLSEIKDIDIKIKNLKITYTQARMLAKNWKNNELKKYPECSFIVNPKIDSGVQRRIQCSLKNNVIRSLLKFETNKLGQPLIFGKEVPNTFSSTPRIRNKKFKQVV